MKNALIITGLAVVLLTSCVTPNLTPKSEAYSGIYEEQPVSFLIMPPINRSTNVEAKEYFHSTLNIPIANAGYYVIPPFLSMEILKRESAYDAELFLNGSLEKFREVFGADVAVFTIIHKWDKSSIGAKVMVDVEYIIKSTKTNEVVYSRRGYITYDTSMSSGASGLAGVIADVALSAINTAATKYVDVARTCNAYTFKDLPAGHYDAVRSGKDGAEMAGMKEFKVMLNKNYK